jgi:8-oxo-dGTP pyrophosphatase MutT (NUDIX family)
MKSTSPDLGEEGEERSAGFVLFRQRSTHRDYLLLRHRNGGHWAFPKGRIEPGEDAQQAARREILEETGIRRLSAIPDFEARSSYRFRRAGAAVHKTVIYFLARVEHEPLGLSAEHSEGRWLDPTTARRTLTFDESRRVLDDAETYLARHDDG